jgi:hypothetical protein
MTQTERMMRVDPDTCRDPDLLNAEVRRLRAVIDSGSATLTDEERFVLREVRDAYADVDDVACNEIAAVLDGLLERTTNA